MCIYRTGTAGSEGHLWLFRYLPKSPESSNFSTWADSPVLFPSPLTGNKCLKLNLCSAGCLSAARLGPSLPPQQWPCWWLTWEEERSCLNRGATAPADILPFSFSLTVRPGAKPGSRAVPARQGLQGERRGSRTESRVLQVGRGKCPEPQNPAWDWTLFPLEQQGFYKVTPPGSASSRLSLGAWPWGLCGGQPGSGYSWTTSSDHCQQAPPSCFTAQWEIIL